MAHLCRKTDHRGLSGNCQKGQMVYCCSLQQWRNGLAQSCCKLGEKFVELTTYLCEKAPPVRSVRPTRALTSFLPSSPFPPCGLHSALLWVLLLPRTYQEVLTHFRYRVFPQMARFSFKHLFKRVYLGQAIQLEKRQKLWPESGLSIASI